MTYAIVARSVSFDYGKHVVLNSVNVNILRGEVYGLLGPSGCGKTTFLKLIIGLLEPKSGYISVFGYKPGSAQSGTPGIGIGYMPQEISLFDYLTINEIFKYFGNIYLLDNDLTEIKMRYFLNKLNLRNEKALICNLSGGEKRRVSLAVALFSSPRLLILDEPTVGVDPLLRETICSFLKLTAKQCKTTIIVTTHYIEEMRCANTVAFMRKGEILEEIEPRKAIEKYKCFNLEAVFLELCVKQRKRKRFSMPKSCDLNSLVEPLNEERSKNIFKNEMNAIKAVILKTFYREKKPALLILALIFSLSSIAMCMFCIGNSPKHVPIGWVVEESQINRTLTDDINEVPYLPELLLRSINRKAINILKYETVEAAIEDTKQTKIMGYIYLKQNFSENFYKRDMILSDPSNYVSNDVIDSGSIHLTLDATNLMLHYLVIKEVFDAVLKFRQNALKVIGIDKNISALPLQFAEAIHGTVATEDFTQQTHNSIICFIMIICISLTMVVSSESMVIDLNSDAYGRSFSSGLKPRHIITGELISRFPIWFSLQAFVLFATNYVFKVTFKGSLLLAIINIQLAVLNGLSLGSLFAVLIPSQFYCPIFITCFAIAMTNVSGAVWPLEAMPYFLKPYAPYTPITLSVTSMLKIFNYEHIDFNSFILPAFIGSTFYFVVISVVTCYLLGKRAT